MVLTRMAGVLAEIFIIISVGYLMAKKDMVSESHFKMLSDLIILITSPALIFYSMYSTYSPELLKTAYIIPVIGAIVPFVTFIISAIAFKIFNIPMDKKAIFFIISSFSNTTFLGLPVNLALFGERSIMVVILYDLGQTTLFWTFGVWLLTNEKISIRGLKKLINPPVVALFLSLAITVIGIKIPEFILKSSQMIGNITIPLAMMFIGMNMVFIDLKEEQVGRSIVIASVIKLIISPILAYFIINIINLTAEVKRVVVLEAALPTMLSSAIIAKQYKSNHKFASIGVLTTTLMCFLSIPLILYIIR